MPIFLLAIPYLLAGTAGAFIGAQIDDKIDTTPQEVNSIFPSPLKIMLYGAGAVALVYFGKKALKA